MLPVADEILLQYFFGGQFCVNSPGHSGCLTRQAMNKQLTTDEVLVKIGSYGRFQIMLTVFINIAYGLWWGFPLYVMMFIASEPGWKCKTHVNSTCPFNKTIHLGDDDYSFRCNIPREDWTFEDDRTSVVTQFDLVCDRGSFGFISTSVMFAGHFIGSLVVSPICDKFGRKIPLFVCGFLCCLLNFLSAFSPTFWVFALFRALVGFMIGGYSIPLFVLTTEFSGKRQRSTAGSLVWIGFGVFYMILPAFAFGIREWKTLTMVTAAPGFLVVAAWFITPESVRWLLKKGRVAEARETLSKVARINRKQMPEESLALPKQEKLGEFRDLFASMKMVHTTLGSWFIWFAASFIGWGVSLSAPFLSGSVYINVVISALSGLVVYPLMTFVNLRFGRRKILMVSFLAAALGSIGALLLTDKAKHDESYRIGKIFLYLFVANLGGDAAFLMVYVYSAELFPTTLRNVGLGTSTAVARVSAFASVYAPYLLTIHRFLPYGIMAGLAVAGAIVGITLPETFNQPTMEDLESQKQEDSEKLEVFDKNDVSDPDNTEKSALM
ncbi:solute carrier family 22 member 15-like isoform X1 [Montipora foliosa]|uniref:solute carrier family 22 member 15-like isoform X1 n=2 Tax=Montipora foliosa TaxID=591990 RepID=UPI0035F1D265